MDAISAAVLSEDGVFRYMLSRRLGWETKRVTFIGLNPSTADAVEDDPTIRRCKSFAASWGAGELWMVNLFAFRSTQPSRLLSAADPIGPENDDWLAKAIEDADIVVAAWGNGGGLLGRAAAVASRFQGKLHALGTTAAGMPRHPLYVRADTPLTVFPSE